eukprot:2504650-Rhodomonas_salina.1
MSLTSDCCVDEARGTLPFTLPPARTVAQRGTVVDSNSCSDADYTPASEEEQDGNHVLQADVPLTKNEATDLHGGWYHKMTTIALLRSAVIESLAVRYWGQCHALTEYKLSHMLDDVTSLAESIFEEFRQWEPRQGLALMPASSSTVPVKNVYCFLAMLLHANRFVTFKNSQDTNLFAVKSHEKLLGAEQRWRNQGFSVCVVPEELEYVARGTEIRIVFWCPAFDGPIVLLPGDGLYTYTLEVVRVPGKIRADDVYSLEDDVPLERWVAVLPIREICAQEMDPDRLEALVRYEPEKLQAAKQAFFLLRVSHRCLEDKMAEDRASKKAAIAIAQHQTRPLPRGMRAQACESSAASAVGTSSAATERGSSKSLGQRPGRSSAARARISAQASESSAASAVGTSSAATAHVSGSSSRQLPGRSSAARAGNSAQACNVSAARAGNSAQAGN